MPVSFLLRLESRGGKDIPLEHVCAGLEFHVEHGELLLLGGFATGAAEKE